MPFISVTYEEAGCSIRSPDFGFGVYQPHLTIFFSFISINENEFSTTTLALEIAVSANGQISPVKQAAIVGMPHLCYCVDIVLQIQCKLKLWCSNDCIQISNGDRHFHAAAATKTHRIKTL